MASRYSGSHVTSLMTRSQGTPKKSRVLPVANTALSFPSSKSAMSTVPLAMRSGSIFALTHVYSTKKKGRAKEIPWNWAKFLVSADGKVVKYFNPRIDPVKSIKDIEFQLDKL